MRILFKETRETRYVCVYFIFIFIQTAFCIQSVCELNKVFFLLILTSGQRAAYGIISVVPGPFTDCLTHGIDQLVNFHRHCRKEKIKNRAETNKDRVPRGREIWKSI